VTAPAKAPPKAKKIGELQPGEVLNKDAANRVVKFKDDADKLLVE
jgi:hypothetical protein